MQPPGHDLVRSHNTNKTDFGQYFRWKTSLKRSEDKSEHNAFP